MRAHLAGYQRFALDEGSDAELAFEIDHELALSLQNNRVWDDFLTEAFKALNCIRDAESIGADEDLPEFGIPRHWPGMPTEFFLWRHPQSGELIVRAYAVEEEEAEEEGEE